MTESHDYTQTVNKDFDPELRRAFEFADKSVDPELVNYDKVRMHKDSIKISGDATFYTLQGEGPTMGLPCVFCRLHVCNLRCTWCDAWYTWNPATEEFWTESRDVSFSECAELIRSQWKCSDPAVPRRVIFSGGEPLIQRKQIDQVVDKLWWPDGMDEGDGEHWDIEFETNGTLMPTHYQLDYAQFNCSPKLANSDNQHHSMVRPKVLEALNNADTTFKFVCETAGDLDEIEEKYAPHISKERVIIMPQGIRSDEIDAHMRALYEPCMERGYRLLGRMQAQFADGARRGV